MSDFGEFSEFTVGSVMGRAWRVMWQKPLAFFGITLLSSVLSFVVAALLGTAIKMLLASFNMPIGAPVGVAFVGFVSFLFVSTIFQGALTYAVFLILLHGEVSIGEAFKGFGGRAFSFISSTLAMAVVLGLLLIQPVIIAVQTDASYGSRIILAVIVMIVAGVFFLITFIMWFVFVPACLIEKRRPKDSLRRGSELAEGYYGKIFGVFFPIWIVVFIFFIIARLIANKIFGVGIFGNIFTAVVGAVPLTYYNVLPTVVYYSLRVVKENLTPDSLADIFD